jgi:phosphoglycerate dehydrogenase-like enzyme
MVTYQVIRTHTSPYHHSNFLEEEKNKINSINGLKYVPIAQARAIPSILLTNTHSDLSKLPTPILVNTKLIIHPNSGFDNFLHDLNLISNTPVILGNSIRAQSVVEYCLGAIFQNKLNIPHHQQWEKSRTWERKLLRENRVWIFGHGHIGEKMALTLETLGLEVHVVDPFSKNKSIRHYNHWKEGELEKADICISALSLNPSTKDYFNKDFFSSVKKDLLFINASRGAVVDELALKTFLRLSPQAYAFLDVFSEEPFHLEWNDLSNLTKTSHIAGVDRQLDQRIIEFEFQILNEFLMQDLQTFLRYHQQDHLQSKLNREGIV